MIVILSDDHGLPEEYNINATHCQSYNNYNINYNNSGGEDNNNHNCDNNDNGVKSKDFDVH